MKKILKNIILLIILVFAISINVYAETIEVSDFTELSNAINDDNYDTIKLKSNIEVTTPLEYSSASTKTLTLTGYTLSGSTDYILEVTGSGNLTVKGGKITSTKNTILVTGENSTLTLDNTSITSTSGNILTLSSSISKVTLKNLTTLNASSGYPIYLNDKTNNSSGILTINNANILTSTSYPGIYSASTSKWNIYLTQGMIITNNLKSGTLLSLSNSAVTTGITKYLDNKLDSTTDNKNITGYMLQFGEESLFHKITINNVTGGTITSKESQAIAGQYVFYQVETIISHKLTGVTVKDSSDNVIDLGSSNDSKSNTFFMPDSDVTITPTYEEKPTYTFDIEPSFQAFADISGFEFIQNSSTKVVATENSFYEGQIVRMTFTPAEGKIIKDFYIKDSSGEKIDVTKISKNVYQAVLPASDITIGGEFANVINLSLNVTNEDYGRVVLSDTESFAGNKEYLEVYPKSGYKAEVTIKDTDNNSVEINKDFSFIVPTTDASITVTFKEIDTYDVNFDLENINGSISYTIDGELVEAISQTNNKASSDSIITLNYIENDGYRFVKWQVLDENDNEVEVIDNQFTLGERNVTVHAIFEAVPTYAISLNDTDYLDTLIINNKTIYSSSTSKEFNAYEGQLLTINPKAIRYYHINTISIKTSSNQDVTITNNTFTMPEEPITISFTYAEGTRVSTLEELKEALTDTKVSQIIINDDIEINETITIDTNQINIFDLGNNTLTGNFNIVIIGEQDLIFFGGKIITTSINPAITINTTSGNITFNTLEITSTNSDALLITSESSTINLDSKLILNSKSNENYSLNINSTNTNINLNGATIITSNTNGGINTNDSSSINYVKGTFITDNYLSGTLIKSTETISTIIKDKSYYLNGFPTTLTDETTITGIVFQFGNKNSFARVYTADGITNGSIVPLQDYALIGSNVYVKVTPDEYCYLDYLLVTDTNDATQKIYNQNTEYYYFNMPSSNITIDAEFINESYKINIRNGEGISIYAKSKAKANEEVSLTYDVGINYTFESIGIVNDDNEDVMDLINYDEVKQTFIMPDYNITIIGTAKRIVHSITFDNIQNGTISSADELNDGVAVRTNVTLYVTPSTGYEIKEILITDENGNNIKASISYNEQVSGKQRIVTFRMPSYDIKISATFTKTKFNITSPTDSKGRITISSSTGYYGDTIIIEAIPYFGYKATGLKVTKDGKTTVYNATKMSFKVGLTDVKVEGVYSYKTTSDTQKLIIKSSTYNSATLNWERLSDVSGYYIYRSTDAKKYTLIKTITSNSTLSFTNTSLTTGKKYYYEIIPYKIVSGKNVKQKVSNIVNITPSVSATSLTGYSNTFTYSRITWTKVTGATGYYVYRSTSKNGTYSKIGTTKNLYYNDKKASNGRTYYYKVIAYRTVSGKAKTGPASNIVSATRLNETINYSLTAGSKSITVNITKSNAAKSYVIYRATSKNGTYKKVATITVNSKTPTTIKWVNTGLTAKKTYYYKIAMINANTSNYSAKKYAKTLA